MADIPGQGYIRKGTIPFERGTRVSARRLLLAMVPVLAGGFLVGGLIAPGFTAAYALPDLPHAVGMEQMDYGQDTVVLPVGDRLWLVNNSNFLHVITLGHDARLEREPGAPHIGNALGLEVMPHGRRYETPPWLVPGVYQLTCTLHNGMNLTVEVVRTSG
jgi:plastocyanin